VKYGIVARGEATLYLRIPSSSEVGYKENIWDHAAGSIITEESGGKVTDSLGRPLEFTSGIKMEKNEGIVASNGILHDVVLKALKRV
jgi:3'(2'), 5'-bisphosphate nucleotidase